MTSKEAKSKAKKLLNEIRGGKILVIDLIEFAGTMFKSTIFHKQGDDFFLIKEPASILKNGNSTDFICRKASNAETLQFLTFKMLNGNIQ